MAKTAAELGLPFSDVVVLMASNELFVPYLSVALQSIVEHVDPARRYDIVVLSTDLSQGSMRTLRAQVERDNVGIGFLDVAPVLGSVRLPCHGHFRREIYYRLIAPELLEGVGKVAYLDCDLVVLRDLAELFDTDVAGFLRAATRDADTAGQCAGYDQAIEGYLRDDVGLDDPYAYFQSGVIVMNLDEFRRRHRTSEIVAVASSTHWHWPDQDVLNHLAKGVYKRLDTRWNSLMDWQHLRRAHIVAQAPRHIQDEYDEARRDPYIVHYAGPDDRPWLYPDCDRAELFWDFAGRSPYLGELKRRLQASRRTVPGLLKRLQVFALFKITMPLIDTVLPPRTRRRVFCIDVYRKLGGNLM